MRLIATLVRSIGDPSRKSHRVVYKIATRETTCTLWLDPTGPTRDEELRKRLFVRDVMTTNVRTVTPRTPIREAARVMCKAKAGCLPVVEAGDRLVGIITSTDMLGFMATLLDQREKTLGLLARLPTLRPRPRVTSSERH